VVQLHLQDEWRIRPDIALQAGFKSSLQFADGQFPVQPAKGAIAGGSTALPVGTINTKNGSCRKSARAGISRARPAVLQHPEKHAPVRHLRRRRRSPWSLSSQAAFDLFKRDAKPETSITYEVGLRGSHP
jgi:hypothetical protein